MILMLIASTMGLSIDEQQELKRLRAKRVSQELMMESEHRRIEHLQRKYWHNACANPECEGYEGKEDEVECPECGNPLLKLID